MALTRPCERDLVIATTTAAATLHSPVAIRDSEPIVRIDGLAKSFPVRRSWAELIRRPFTRAATVTVLNGVSFDVRRGEFFGLLGANGAGKTTLFRILATQLLPDGGTATVGDMDVVRDASRVRDMLTPVVADERSLNWRLTARENLELYAALYDIDRTQVAARVDEVLEVVELENTGPKMVGMFSSGMKQRLLIARALLARPRVLLLDEPTRSLDPLSARRFRQFLREEVAGRQQCTVLLATHSAEEAFDLCDRVAVLDRGVVLATGTVDELMSTIRDDCYSITVRHAQADAVMRALGDARPKLLPDRGDEGWSVLEAHLPGGPDGAAEAVSRLTRAAIDVAGIEHRRLTLADLLERIVLAKTVT